MVFYVKFTTSNSIKFLVFQAEQLSVLFSCGIRVKNSYFVELVNTDDFDLFVKKKNKGKKLMAFM